MSSFMGYGMHALKVALSVLLIWASSENTASGTARSMEIIQMVMALTQVHSTALEVWMSMGFTIALYLKVIKMQMQINRYIFV